MFAEYGVLNYWTYLVGAIFIVLVPGPNTLFVLKNSVSSGMKGGGNDSNLLIVFYVQIMPDDFVMQLHR
ncbi:hypothetical protein POW46_07910, partial [Escherichia coli]